MNEIEITGDPDLIPQFMHDTDAGCDLMAAHDGTIIPGQRQLVNTGIRIALPTGYAAFVHPRSGLALKNGITVLNAPGTIDAEYRGEVGVILYNAGGEDFRYERGSRIAQLIFQKIEQPTIIFVESLDLNTSRGEKGFGSTGISS